MTAGSDVRLNTERIAALARELRANMIVNRDGEGVFYVPVEVVAERVFKVADAAGSWNDTERIEAAAKALDELSGPDAEDNEAIARTVLAVAGSWNDTERLRTALTDLLAANEQHHNAPPDWTRLDVALDAARAALAASVPSPPAKPENAS